MAMQLVTQRTNFGRELPVLLGRDRMAWLRLAVMMLLSVAILARSAQVAISLTRARWLAVTSHEIRPTEVARGVGTANAAQDLSRVLSAHLFGTATEPVDHQPGLAPAQWVLSGVIEGSTPEAGLAIIGETRETTRLRAIGQEVANGFKLAQVLSDRVTIERPGQRLELRLPRSRWGHGSLVSLAETAVLDGTLTASAWHPRKGWPANRPPAMVMLKPGPHLDPDGRYDGMRVWGAGNGSALQALGLQRNDVITRINGQAINNDEAARTALEQMSTGVPVMVTIVRDGSAQELPISIVDSGG
jgi:type II secretion system protein C